MTKIEYVEILDKNPSHESNPADVAKELEKIIYKIQSDSGWSMRFICSNFLGTKPVYGEPDSNSIYNVPNNTLYQFMLFFEERYGS